MKTLSKLLLLIIVCLVSFSGFSQKKKKQKVDYDKVREYMLLDGQYYAKMVKQNYNKIGLIKNYSIRNKEDKELIFFKYSPYQTRNNEGNMVNKDAYTVTFINGGGHVYFKKNFGERGVMKLLAENNLIKNDKIDPDAENRFISINRGKKGSDKTVDNATSDIQIEGKEILRDGAVIGKFSEKNITSSEGVDLISINVYNSVGEKVANAIAPVTDPDEWSVLTSSDSKTSDILYESPGERKKLFNWLILKKYL